MRITNALVTQRLIAGVTGNSAKLQEAQERVTTGLKVKKMSDDPTSGSAIMLTSSALRAVTQFKRNTAALGTELDAEDSALGQVGDVLTRAKELAVGASGANANAASRAATALEVKSLIGQIIQVGNTRLGDGFLFGGSNSMNAAPFDQNQTGQLPAYVAIPAGGTTPLLPQGSRPVEISAAQTMPGAHDGDTVFVQSGVLTSLQALYDGLVANDPAAISTSEAKIDEAMDHTQALVGDVGARRNRVDAASASLDVLEANLQTKKSDLSEVDMEQAITEMVARQTAYQAAMLASSKVMGLSLTDYLR
jgi:flagellar hook-associated protein 3 FlgL